MGKKTHKKKEKRETVEKNEGKEEVKETKKEKETGKDYLQDLQRVQAEFENFRKRVEEERKEWMKLGKTEILLELLTVYEGLEKAVANEKENSGIKLVFEEFKRFLEKNEVKEIECLEEKFDSGKMHVMNTARDEEKEDGIVLEVFQKGFLFKGNVLRPALVQVNKLN